MQNDNKGMKRSLELCSTHLLKPLIGYKRYLFVVYLASESEGASPGPLRSRRKPSENTALMETELSPARDKGPRFNHLPNTANHIKPNFSKVRKLVSKML